MKSVAVIAFLILMTSVTAVSPASASDDSSVADQSAVPVWIKNTAGWWADGLISDDEFLSAIEFLIKSDVIAVSSSPSQSSGTDSSAGAGDVPQWVKNTAGWWAENIISDTEFLSGIGYLVESGVISVSSSLDSDAAAADDVSAESPSVDPRLQELEAALEECSEIAIAYKRSDCEKLVEHDILVHVYQTQGQQFVLGPITYYWFGSGSEGNEFEITPTGQPILSVRMLAENTSSEITALNCTSPSICSYDVWDGAKAFKYAGMDFTSGTITLNPGVAKEFNILFGPNIGYGGTEFEYDSQKSYYFRINEPFGSTDVLLDLQ